MLPWLSIFVATLLSVYIPKLIPWIVQKRQQRLAQRISPPIHAKIPFENFPLETVLLPEVTDEEPAEEPAAESAAEPAAAQVSKVESNQPGEDMWQILFPSATDLSPPETVIMEDLTSDQMDYMYFHPLCNDINATERMLSLFDEYPHLGLSLDRLHSFHPVVNFPEVRLSGDIPLPRPYYMVKNLSQFSKSENITVIQGAITKDPLLMYGVGKYNERRSNLYDMELFQESSELMRDIHVGIDLYGPLHTPVYSFTSGHIAFAGYNPAEGDYGNVVIVEHELGTSEAPVKVWALYGHLSGDSIRDKVAGQPVKLGEVIGWMGDVSENGGWESIHVHFQLSTIPPTTHDMPGAVSLNDREHALREYPDPRLVVGWLYDG